MMRRHDKHGSENDAKNFSNRSEISDVSVLMGRTTIKNDSHLNLHGFVRRTSVE